MSTKRVLGLVTIPNLGYKALLLGIKLQDQGSVANSVTLVPTALVACRLQKTISSSADEKRCQHAKSRVAKAAA